MAMSIELFKTCRCLQCLCMLSYSLLDIIVGGAAPLAASAGSRTASVCFHALTTWFTQTILSVCTAELFDYAKMSMHIGNQIGGVMRVADVQLSGRFK